MIAAQEPLHRVNIIGRLVVNRRSLAVGQICQDWLTLIDPCELPDAHDAELVVTVRGTDKRYFVVLPNGITKSGIVKFF